MCARSLGVHDARLVEPSPSPNLNPGWSSPGPSPNADPYLNQAEQPLILTLAGAALALALALALTLTLTRWSSP